MSAGRTILRYHAKSPELLSFGIDQNVLVFSKEAGTDKDLWGVEVRQRQTTDLDLVVTTAISLSRLMGDVATSTVDTSRRPKS